MNPIATELVRDQVAAAVEEAVARTPISDIHTHLYDPEIGRASCRERVCYAV